MEQMFHRYETKSACRFRTGFLFAGARFPYRPKVVFAVHDAGCVPTHSSFYNWHNNNRFYLSPGSCRALGRCFDKGAEQDIGKRVEPGLHRDHVRTDDSRVRGIYGDVFVLQPFGKLLGEQ